MHKAIQMAVEVVALASIAGAVALFMLSAAGVFGEQERGLAAKTGTRIIVNEQRLVGAINR